MIDASKKHAPSMVEMATMAATRPGIEPPTPRWTAVLNYLDGSPLSEQDVTELVAATGRSREAIIEHARRTLGRRRFRAFWARVGRRARKSSTAALIAVWEALYGGHAGQLMPGEQGLVAIISRDIAGANVISRFVKLYAEALGFRVGSSRMGAVQLLEIEGCALAVATLASSTEAPRGYAIPVLILDEYAHLPSGDEYQDTDSSIIASAAPAQAQFANPLIVGISTPLGEDGVFHERVEAAIGNDRAENDLAVQGPTWEWTSITKERTHEIERDPDIHGREFGAVPSKNEGTAFRSDDVAACYGDHPGQYLWGEPFMIWDPGESLDTFAWCCAAWLEPDKNPAPVIMYAPESAGFVPNSVPIGQKRDEMGSLMWHPVPTTSLLRVFDVGGFTGDELRQTTMDVVVASLAQTARNCGVKVAFTDQRGAPYLAAMASKHGLSVRSFAWTQERKHEAVILVRSLMRDRQLSLVQHEEMKRQLLRYKRRITGGGFRYGTPRQHDDFAALLLTLGMALGEEQQGTPTDQTHFRIENAPTKRALGGRHVATGR